MKKLFEYVQHIGRYRVLVGTKDIADGAVTRQKLSNELWEEIGRMCEHELLVAVRNLTTYEETADAYEEGKVIVGLSGNLYFQMIRRAEGVFYFTQLNEEGRLLYMTLGSNGWSEVQNRTIGDIDMDIINVDDIIHDN